jgi:hypothetical protein
VKQYTACLQAVFPFIIHTIMGRLIELKDLDLDARWYFKDAYFSRDSRKIHYTWPSEQYPNCVAIHYKDIEDYNSRKIEIREWIEEKLNETVITAIVDKSFRYFWGGKEGYDSWERSYEVDNHWYGFYFKHKESALAFNLVFSEYVKPITDLPPDGDYEYEKTSHCKTNR